DGRTGDAADDTAARLTAHRIDLDAHDVVALEEAPPGFGDIARTGQFRHAAIHHGLDGLIVNDVGLVDGAGMAHFDDPAWKRTRHAPGARLLHGSASKSTGALIAVPEAMQQPAQAATRGQPGARPQQKSPPCDATAARSAIRIAHD